MKNESGFVHVHARSQQMTHIIFNDIIHRFHCSPRVISFDQGGGIVSVQLSGWEFEPARRAVQSSVWGLDYEINEPQAFYGAHDTQFLFQHVIWENVLSCINLSTLIYKHAQVTLIFCHVTSHYNIS